ncbi:class I SAM-dependent RNA methyltransferase [uncultured Fibrobacter sp.]|uniref:class I SAM-dependent RNA methyltransferase n=1 Tax=uncultured Fibrobacter sp. TaxID=261512 RepID=UPI0025954A1F|nr:class I SAM-dependent RNA methyltransferase [uncultured Fibrobacter sp.]
MISFANALRQSLPKELSGLSLLSLSIMDYKDELVAKNKAFSLFCQENALPNPERIVESPLPRNYRTTTKRRVVLNREKFQLVFDEEDNCSEFAEPLEPAEHLAVYRFIESYLQKPVFNTLAEVLNWVIIRGSYKWRTVIFNVCEMNALVVRKLKLMGEHLNASGLDVRSAHVYFDPTRSDYYLEAQRPVNALAFKTLYGPKDLTLDLGTCRLKYPVTGFSQINESQIPNLLRCAETLLQPSAETDLLDLYCGYGLFSFGIGEKANSTFGVEWEGASIEYAKNSARFLKRQKSRFLAGKIDASFVEKRIPKSQSPEVMLLDPPRKGVDSGVIAALARRKPERILHIFCGTDEIPRSLNQWRLANYRVQKIVPLDLFPGTPHLETAVLMTKADLKR